MRRRLADHKNLLRLGASLLFCITGTSASRAADYFGNPSNYLQQIGQLQPGDRLLLEPGIYRNCLSLQGLNGTDQRPIIIQGPDLSTPARFIGSGCLNQMPPLASVIVRIQESSHLVIRSLELDAEGLGVVGVQAGYGWPAVHNITLEDLYIHDNDVSSQISGISCFTTSWDWVIRKNRIERTGLGMYLGNSDGSDPFIRGLIEENLIINPKGYGIQIKHQNQRFSQTGLPTGDSVTTIRHNVIIKAMNAALGAAARPNLLVGHFPRTGIGEFDRYEIYGNFFYENDSDAESLFQGEGNIAFHDNVLFNSFRGPGIWIAPHNDVPKNIVIYRNTIVTRAWGLVVMGGDQRYRQWAVGNAFFSSAVMAMDLESNFEASFSDAATYLNNPNSNLSILDLYPLMGALSSTVVDYSQFSHHQDWNKDFNGQLRTGEYRGAYAGSGLNPGWKLALDFKQLGVSMPPLMMDAGFVDSSVMDSGAFDAGVRIDMGIDDAAVSSPIDAAFILDSGFSTDAPINVNDANGVTPVADAGFMSVMRPERESKNSDSTCACATFSTKPQDKGPMVGWLALALLLYGRRLRRIRAIFE